MSDCADDALVKNEGDMMHRMQETKLNRRNRAFLRLFGNTPFTIGLHPDPRMVSEVGTVQDCDAMVKAVKRRIKICAAVCGAAVLLSLVLPKKEPNVPPPVAYQSAGAVESVQLHETAFSTSTSVTTSAGVFQVSGAVTASPGDQAKISVNAEGSQTSSNLCVESRFKTHCYRLR